MRPLAPMAFLSISVPALLALPVTTPPADDPHPVRPTVESLSVKGVDPSALQSLGAGEQPELLTAEQTTRAFDTLGVTWADDAAAGTVQVQVRTRVDGDWSGWTPLDLLDDGGPDSTSAEARSAGVRQGTAPVWVGDADGVQVRVDTATGVAPTDVQVELVDPGESDADDDLDGSAPAYTATAATPAPRIISRAEWGADESIRGGGASYSPTVKVAYVHHTASTNSYSESEAAAQVRGFYAYHVKSLGWSDIGYNFLVDKYGRIYEGRAGGISRPVVGAHAGGFNSGTMGVSMIGTYTTTAPTSATLNALTELLAWKLSLHDVDPKGKAVLTSGGGSTARYPSGTSVTVNTIAGHRDTNSTACPGDAGYAKLPGLRDAVAKRMADLGATGQVPSDANPIAAKHEALGGNAGLLGAPVSDERAIEGGRSRAYQRGTIFWSEQTGAHEVHGGVLTRYLAAGGPSGPLGFPTSDERDVAGGRENAFSGGRIIYRSDTGAVHVVRGGIGEKFEALGGVRTLGLPTSDETVIAGGARSTFDRGHIYWSPQAGSQAVMGGILDTFLATGGPSGALGFPTTDETAVKGGRASTFTNGVITWSSSTGAHPVFGGIYQRYAALGGPNGSLGLATSGETPVAGGVRSTFTNGHIYWSPRADSKALYGGILEKYLALGGPTGVLGLPVGEETATTGGRVASFAGGRVYWSPGTGAHGVWGGINQKYSSLGGSKSFLGLPLTDEHDYAGGRRSTFVGGHLMWHPATGVHEVHGGILSAYLQGGGALTYGFPVSDEYDVPGGRATAFQRAILTYHSATGQVAVRMR